MKKILLAVTIIIAFSFNAYAYKLTWSLEKDDRIEMVKTAGVKYYVNANLSRIYEERNIIDITCTEKSDRLNRVHGVFSVHEKEYGSDSFKMINQTMVDFLIEPSGKFIVRKGDYMPNLRHIPSFPVKEIKINDTWTADGEMVLDNFSRPFMLRFPVEYTFVNVIKDNEKDIAVINYYYSINIDTSAAGYPADFPIRISGENKGIIHWDITGNKPRDIQDAYQIAFIFATGGKSLASAEFHMNIKTENSLYKNFTPKEKETAKEEMQKELPEGVDADVDKRGIVIRMNDLLFDFDKYNLREDTREKLDRIAEAIKKKYPDREIIVEGHTDSRGEKSYNQSLSEKRAMRVSDYLKSKSGHDKFSYKGYGQSNPLGDNSTEQGRAKNRRVEIIIKTN
ncbi:MAG: OmpA family protein [Spirochaetae bacterium HGW-Spirochaetae-5]|nr:MAG: OmpA family protein [Spirochaetae bacterium HGW-Spirochaetae-5]